MQHRKRGFTLIELLVVVLIIGILAAVALPQYNKAVKKAQGVEALSVMNAVDKALRNYYLEHGTFEGATLDTLNVTLPELSHIRYAIGSPGDYNTATSQPVLQTGTSPVILTFPENKIRVEYLTKDRNNLSMRIWCRKFNGTQSSCGEYFNCTPNEWGHCKLK